MALLPIVERELRVALQKRSTFSLRAVAAVAAVVLAGVILLAARFGGLGITAPGLALFRTLTWIAAAGCILAGLVFASSALAEEKREGTLGLLFLTDLSGYDIVGGKLLAIWLRAFYALLAIFPVLALAFFIGGVDYRQFWKTALALINVLFWSLSVGLFVSGLSRDGHKAMGGTFMLLFLFAVFGPCLDALVGKISGRNPSLFWSGSSPVFVFTAAGGSGSSLYWRGLGTTQLLSWGLLGLTCLLVPHAWQDRKRHLEKAGWRHAFKYGTRRRRRVIRRRWMEQNPVLWLTGRDRWQSNVLWAVCLLLTATNAGYAVLYGPRQIWSAWDWLLTLARFSVYLWAASQAGRFLVEARRGGLLELLLTTPVSLRQLIKGQWQAWIHLYALPLIALLMLPYVAACCAQSVTWGIARLGGTTVQPGPLIVNAAVNLLGEMGDLIALGWFGLWMGVTSKNTTLATVRTLVFVQVIPWLAIVALSVLVAVSLSTSQALKNVNFPPWLNVWVPVIITAVLCAATVAKDIGSVIWSRRRLYSRLRTQASEGTSAMRTSMQPSPSSVSVTSVQLQTSL